MKCYEEKYKGGYTGTNSSHHNFLWRTYSDISALVRCFWNEIVDWANEFWEDRHGAFELAFVGMSLTFIVLFIIYFLVLIQERK